MHNMHREWRLPPGECRLVYPLRGALTPALHWRGPAALLARHIRRFYPSGWKVVFKTRPQRSAPQGCKQGDEYVCKDNVTGACAAIEFLINERDPNS